MNPDTIDRFIGLAGLNRNLILVAVAFAALGLLFSVGAFIYARWTHTIGLMILERVSQEQNARLHAQMRSGNGSGSGTPAARN